MDEGVDDKGNRSHTRVGDRDRFAPVAAVIAVLRWIALRETVVVQPHEINGKPLRREHTTLMRESAAPVMRLVRWTVGGKPAIAAQRRPNPNSLSADGDGRVI